MAGRMAGARGEVRLYFAVESVAAAVALVRPLSQVELSGSRYAGQAFGWVVVALVGDCKLRGG